MLVSLHTAEVQSCRLQAVLTASTLGRLSCLMLTRLMVLLASCANSNGIRDTWVPL